MLVSVWGHFRIQIYGIVFISLILDLIILHIAFKLKKTPLEMMHHWNSNRIKTYFSVSSQLSAPVYKNDPYTSTLILADVGVFIAEGPTMLATQDDVIKQAYIYLKNVNSMLAKFKAICLYSDSSTAIMEELISKCPDIIKLETGLYGNRYGGDGSFVRVL